MNTSHHTHLTDLLAQHYQAQSPSLLGSGAEGVVFCQGDRAFKCLVNPKRWQNARTLLQSLSYRTKDHTTLPDVLSLRAFDDVLILETRYEPHQALGRTLPEEWLTFLQDMEKAGLAHKDIKPENFVRVPTGIRLVDLGDSLCELTPGRFEDMARRCFLSWRFAQRDDLRDLIRQARTRRDHPALIGFDAFLLGLDSEQPFHDFDTLLLKECQKIRASRILDYGAGKGWLAGQLTQLGGEVTAFDPDPEMVLRLTALKIKVWKEEDLEHAVNSDDRFDLIILSRVLCEVECDQTVLRILARIRKLLTPNGRLVLAVCDPFFADARRTAIQQRSTVDTTQRTPQVLTKRMLRTHNERKDVYRPWTVLERMIRRAGFHAVNLVESPGVDLDLACPASEFLLSTWKPSPTPAPVSLLIKCCAMDHAIAELFIRHQVKQLDSPRPFAERVVVVDSRNDDYLRQHTAADRPKLLATLTKLVEEGIIDRVVEASDDPSTVAATYRRWFGEHVAELAHSTHAANGQQIHAVLTGVDACNHDLVLAVDLDLVIRRANPEHDWLNDALQVFESDPLAFFVSPSICRPERQPATWCYESDEPIRVDTNATLIDRARLRSLLPVPAAVEHGQIQFPWHRIFDEQVKKGQARAYRCFDDDLGWIHVPNDKKTNVSKLGLIIDRVERGHVPQLQLNERDLVKTQDWWGPARTEPYVFVVVGRNVSCSKARRCLDSIRLQDRSDYGIILVDDASTTELGAYLSRLLERYADKTTLVQSRVRNGGMFNLNLAARHICQNPESVIITLDLDDALIGPNVLSKIHSEYTSGADLTVGSMFGVDKPRHYHPDFAKPRSRSSNVWQHLRSFKKRLFDAIPQDAFKLNGHWVELPYDWAYMVPLVELSRSPRYIPQELYYYEPGTNKTTEHRKARDAQIAQILAKPPMTQHSTKRPPLIAIVGNARLDPNSDSWHLAHEMGKRIVEAGWRLLTGGLGGAMKAASKGARSSAHYKPGSCIGLIPGLNPDDANPYVDISLATGLGDGRNLLIANSDALIVIGGGAGTLSEVALAWARRRLIIALGNEGWAARLAGTKLDHRDRKVPNVDDQIFKATSPQHAITLLAKYLPRYVRRPRESASPKSASQKGRTP